MCELWKSLYILLNFVVNLKIAQKTKSVYIFKWHLKTFPFIMTSKYKILGFNEELQYLDNHNYKILLKEMKVDLNNGKKSERGSAILKTNNKTIICIFLCIHSIISLILLVF